MFSFIVALDKNGLIGKGNDLPWRLPADLKHFKRITMGKPIIMGRKTCESIGRPLPGRRNIVLSRDADFGAEGFEVFHSADELFDAIKSSTETMIIGGAEIYRLLLDQSDRAYVTVVDGEFQGDTWFPQWPLKENWKLVSEEPRAADEKNPHDLRFRVYQRER